MLYVGGLLCISLYVGFYESKPYASTQFLLARKPAYMEVYVTVIYAIDAAVF